eukprot:symbB.v1.2.016671.t1/scaffold1269.1/size127624/3
MLGTEAQERLWRAWQEFFLAEVSAEKFLQAVLEEFSCGHRKGGAPPSSMGKVLGASGQANWIEDLEPGSPTVRVGDAWPCNWRGCTAFHDNVLFVVASNSASAARCLHGTGASLAMNAFARKRQDRRNYALAVVCQHNAVRAVAKSRVFVDVSGNGKATKVTKAATRRGPSRKIPVQRTIFNKHKLLSISWP